MRLTSLFEKLFALPRLYKRKIVLAFDVVVSCLGLIIASALTFSFEHPVHMVGYLWLAPVVHIIVGSSIGNYSSALRFVDNRTLLSLVYPVAISTSIVATISATQFDAKTVTSLSTIYFFIVLALALVGRLLPQVAGKTSPASCQPVIIYGAGEAGKILLSNLESDKRFYPCALVDDNQLLAGETVNDVDVYHSDELPRLLSVYSCTDVFLAIPSAKDEQRRKIIRNLESLHVKVQTVPKLDVILSDVEQIKQVEDIDINDLLGRKPVPPDSALMHKCITGKSVLITGAGGSIGSELCRQIVLQKPKVIVLYEISEFNLYKIDHELRMVLSKNNVNCSVIAALGDIKDETHLKRFIKQYKVQTIYHSAAYKHVPLVEHNVMQGIYNNVIGSYIVAKLAFELNIETCVLISTDKAVRPTNVMGATKRLSELCFQAFAKESDKTRFSMVRFGNVLGSSGSVVPLFREQARAGGPLTVTHKEITRFFMTISEASELVIQAGAMARGGEVFVLDMGEPVKIYDLAKKVINLMGLQIKSEETDINTDGIEIKFTGLRPGEKLFEELLISDDVEGTTHSRIMMSQETFIDLQKCQLMIEKLHSLLDEHDPEALIQLLLDYCDGFDHKSGNSDHLKSNVKEQKHSFVVINN